MGEKVWSANPQGKILALGELLVDLIPAEQQMRIQDTGPVLKTASGSAGIFACAAARLGAPVGFIGKVGRDPLSRMVTEAIQREGVDTRCLTVSDEGQIATISITAAIPSGAGSAPPTYRNPAFPAPSRSIFPACCWS